MSFHRARLKHKNIKIVLVNVILAEVASLKYLRLIIDNKLKWIEHIAHIKKKVSRGIDIISKAKPFLNSKSLVDLYYSFVYPYLIYCVEVWGNAADIHLNPIF